MFTDCFCDVVVDFRKSWVIRIVFSDVVSIIHEFSSFGGEGVEDFGDPACRYVLFGSILMGNYTVQQTYMLQPNKLLKIF